LRIGLVAGEASGDLLGAGLIRSIRARCPDARFEGVAGPAMIAAGCEALADAEALAVFGLIEPLVHIPGLLRLRRALIRRWRASPPDVFVGIDAPEFNLGLEKRLRGNGIATVHYVSPSIWVWRAGRIETVRKAADRVLCILPFEKALYDAAGIDAVFVGHPKADSLPAEVDVAACRERLGLGPGPLVAVLPGSRAGEVARLGPEFAAAAAQLAGGRPELRFVMPVASPKLRALCEAQLADAAVRQRFTLVDGDSIGAMSAADVVLLASGTAALESALLGKPTVAAYRVAPLTAAIVRLLRLIRTDYYTLPNLLTETPLIPEFIQEAVSSNALANAVGDFLDDRQARAAVARRFAKLRSELALGADDRAAEAVVSLARKD
jgi:lipid-A-disaccharide synthase